MTALPLLLAVTLASPGPSLHVEPLADPGPFQAGELVASAVGVAAGDALVLAGGYGLLQLFAQGTIRPTAGNFRTTAYGMGAAALLVPPLTAVLLARWARAEPASGAFWKALLLASAGQALAIGAGLAAYPHFWVILPVQLLAVTAGTTIGLHWGRGPRREEDVLDREPPSPAPAREARREPICPDPALAIAGR